MSRRISGAKRPQMDRIGAPADQYFSHADSLKWFIQPNDLECRWSNLRIQSALFTLGETHFGCGSNFLHSAALWQASAPSSARLHYVAAHPAPLTRIELRLATARYLGANQPPPLLAELLAHYPATVKGVHRLVLGNGTINLTLLFGDAAELFEQIALGAAPQQQETPAPRVDAWFMPCSAHIGEGLGVSAAALSSNGTSFAALSQCNATAEQLAACGFLSATTNQPADGMLCGQYTAAAALAATSSATRPARQLYWHINRQAAALNPPQQALVLGAGIAGCCTARALATRGYEVTVVDRHPTAGSEGSGNRQAIVYPKLSLRDELLPRINLAAMLFASRYYRPFWEAGFGAQCGVLVLPHNEKVAAEQRQISARLKASENWVRLLQGRQLTAISGLQHTAECGLFFPQLGWLPPVDLCGELLRHPKIRLLRGQAERLVYCDTNKRWSFLDGADKTIAEAPIAVVASAFGCRQFAQTEFLPVAKVRGQISHLAVNSESQSLRTVLCGKGYFTPASGGQHSFGATYNPDLDCSDVRQRDHRENIRQLIDTDAQLGKLFAASEIAELDGRANFRCTTKDYLPIVGGVPDVEPMSRDFAALRHDARSSISATGSYLPNLYIHCGLGSRGLGYAPLAAELLACEIANELPPLERTLRLAMHPARFLIRDLKRRQR